MSDENTAPNPDVFNPLEKIKEYIEMRISECQQHFNRFNARKEQNGMDIFYGKIAAFDEVLLRINSITQENTLKNVHTKTPKN